MSLNKTWVLTCDMCECDNSFQGLPVPARDQSLQMAFNAGWGRLPIGKFNRWIYLCPTHRVMLLAEWEPERFQTVVENHDHTADHTVLLACGHEFGRQAFEGDVCTGQSVDCSACRQKWFTSGEVIGLPDFDDIIREIP